MYSLLEAHPESAEELSARVAAANKTAPLVSAKALKAIRGAERTTGDGVEISGTGLTVLKLRQPPLAYLIDKGQIAGEEMQAADEISLAFYALSSRLMVRGIDYLREVSGGAVSGLPWAARTAKAVDNYQKWANLWSARNKQYADPTLEITIAAIIDERHIRGIAHDLGFSPRRVERAILNGLRDYAARTEDMDQRLAKRWLKEAAEEFAPIPAPLRTAMRRARVER